MGQPGESEQQPHSPERVESARPAQDALDGFRRLYSALAIAFVVLLVDTIQAVRGGDILLPLLQLLLVVLLVMATFRSDALPKVIAGVCAGWLLLVGMTITENIPRLSGGWPVVVLMVGTLGLATTHAVLARWAQRTAS